MRFIQMWKQQIQLFEEVACAIFEGCYVPLRSVAAGTKILTKGHLILFRCPFLLAVKLL